MLFFRNKQICIWYMNYHFLLLFLFLFYVFCEIILYFDKQSIQKSPDCLSIQISCMMNFAKQTKIFDYNEEQEIELIKENISEPIISFDIKLFILRILNKERLQ